VWDILDNNQTLFLFKIVVKQDQEYLKPSVVHALANAELYCLALAHIYADPNYSQLNHWGVIQALNRKGVYVAEPSDVALTETTLIHTSPLRMVIKLHSIHF
jgi:calmodulin-regulated spectrin-associated protein